MSDQGAACRGQTRHPNYEKNLRKIRTLLLERNLKHKSSLHSLVGAEKKEGRASPTKSSKGDNTKGGQCGLNFAYTAFQEVRWRGGRIEFDKGS